MSTNFYLKKRQECLACGSIQTCNTVHIGKSSLGWCFSLHVYSNNKKESGLPTPQSLEDWKDLFKSPQYYIEDEYGEAIPSEKMLKIILDRGHENSNSIPLGYSSWEDFYRSNHAVRGPNGLVRHAIDGRHCIGHGDGTYDLIVGDFR